MDEQLKGQRNKKARLYAGITTIAIVIIWLVLVSVFAKEEEPRAQVDSSVPDIEAFLQQAGQEFNNLGSEFQNQNQQFQQVLEEAETQESLESQEALSQ
jgi:hypothetical protein